MLDLVNKVCKTCGSLEAFTSTTIPQIDIDIDISEELTGTVNRTGIHVRPCQ